MTFTKTILVSAVISNMESAVCGFIKAGRMTEEKAAIAKARIVKMQEWLESKDESFFPEAATGNTESFKGFEEKACKEFMVNA